MGWPHLWPGSRLSSVFSLLPPWTAVRRCFIAHLSSSGVPPSSSSHRKIYIISAHFLSLKAAFLQVADGDGVAFVRFAAVCCGYLTRRAKRSDSRYDTRPSAARLELRKHRGRNPLLHLCPRHSVRLVQFRHPGFLHKRSVSQKSESNFENNPSIMLGYIIESKCV